MFFNTRTIEEADQLERPYCKVYILAPEALVDAGGCGVVYLAIHTYS